LIHEETRKYDEPCFNVKHAKQGIKVVAMKTDYLEKESPPIGILAQHSLSFVAELVKDLLTGALNQENKMSYWQLIFLQSRANGCFYRFEDFAQVSWQWPKDTWFQERLSQKLRDAEFAVQRLNN
jgi:hypothetical protein